jgi:general secretion pathway protein G
MRNGVPRRRPGEGGFTLIELLVVIVILGILVTVLAVSLADKPDQARWKLTVIAVDRLKGEVSLFKVHEGRFPANLEELVEHRQIERVPKDGWNRPFEYRVPGVRGAPFDIVSTGADGIPGGTGVDEDIWSHPPK